MIKMFHEGHRRVKINKLDLEMHRTGRHIIMQEKNNGITHIFMCSIWQMFKDVCAVDSVYCYIHGSTKSSPVCCIVILTRYFTQVVHSFLPFRG